MSYACMRGHSEVLKVLLESGADPAMAEEDHVGPMEISRLEGHHDCTMLLQVGERREAPCLCRHTFFPFVSFVLGLVSSPLLSFHHLGPI